VDPATGTLGLAYAHARWGLELTGRFAGRRNGMPDAPAGTAFFQSPGYSVLDLYAHWTVAEQLRLNVGVTNMADRTYWAAGDIPLVASTSSTLDRYTAPGRSLSASVSFDW
jgi:hemoglobin/transferrin/lactoferrin receptor protein